MRFKITILVFLIFGVSAGVSAQQYIGFPGGVPRENGSVTVYVQDQTSDVIDLHLTRYIDDITITSDTSIEDTTVSITCDTTPVVGNTVCFKEDFSFYQGQIKTITSTGGTGYEITLETPLDFAFTTAGGCSLQDEKLNVDGSVTPVTFSVSPVNVTDINNPSSPQKWDITRIMLSMTDASSMDDGKFGGIPGGLANGIVLRKKDGRYKNVFNARTNGDLALHAYDVAYIPDTLGPGGLYGLRMRRSFGGQDKNGVTIRLDGGAGDEIQLIVRDDLTLLDSFYAVVQGHVVISPIDPTWSNVQLSGGAWTLVLDGKKSGDIFLNDFFIHGISVYLMVVDDGGPAPTGNPRDNDAILIYDGNISVNLPSNSDVYLYPEQYTIDAVIKQ